MLTNVKVRCVYCRQASYFYVHSWKGKVYAALYTQCPKCEEYDDVYHFLLEDLDKNLKDVLAGKDLPGSKKGN